MNKRSRHSGTVGAAIVLLVLVAVAVTAGVRYFWARSANKHFDSLITVYILEKEQFNEDDRNSLRTQLLEAGMSTKILRWDRDSFIKDQVLYNEMISARDQRQLRLEEQQGSVVDAVINL